MAEDTPLVQAIVSNLLWSPPEWEEIMHPWGSVFSVNPDLPLLRTWDGVSGSQPSESGRMLARLPRERLDTSTARETFLATHANHGIWEPTPFISFTQSPQELQDNVNWRKKKRGSQTITVVNPYIRIDKGLPVLNMADEMRHYGVPDPYGRANEYYKNHYICLWEVTEEEVVGNWEWDDLLKTNRWYEQVILLAFKEHNERYDARSGAFKMSALRDALFDSTDLCSCSETEEYGVCFGDESDSSDEVEANNAMDDALKLLEEA
ncbi:hypothetical protein ETB97_003977 [Aspergillus alliaceus]|uniref:DUF7587 domain-containing protein n=1 Tax=Petromyces alliaceus TaxID=209559 RepID=A0A8H6E409_PETAA|nr:hypothetical protein ETB97_003977 [Aspergillus burnettii]